MRTLTRLVRSAAAPLVAAATGAALAVTVVAGPAAAAPGTVAVPLPETSAGVYVVLLDQVPAAAYGGGLPGIPATRPAPGERFDRTRPAVEAYADRLRAAQDRVLEDLGDPRVLYRYTTAVNGFAARLDPEQVRGLRDRPGVALVRPDTNRRLAATDSPGFLEVADAWAEAGGPTAAGRGTVVGVVDSGIWPENASFAGVPLPQPGRSPKLPGFHGACASGFQWDARDCDSKLVSARWFVRGFGAGNVARSDHLSPRDGSGHGSHVASVAVGNEDVGVRVAGQGFGRSAGMAPGARLAAYKACWAAPDPADDGCSTADLVAAVDRAVADGVDVLNVSVEGTDAPATDPLQHAYLHATAAGVFVAAPAGNAGPRSGSVGNAAPWVTTVAAGTHVRRQGAVRLGDGARFVGAMVSDRAVPESGLVLGADAPAPGASAAAARRCEIGALDADRVQDKIVVCARGTTARVDKSSAVARAGGVGMVLGNVVPDSTDADFHAVPTVHVDAPAYRAIRGYAESGGPATAAIDPAATNATPVPQIADFSARGPAEGGVLKPDLTAPGVSVLSASAPVASAGRLWDLASGTSVSSAHVAGLAALLRSVYPTWSPAEIRSAMMTTAYPLEGTAGPFAEGAGHVDPTAFLDPGLVLDTGYRDYRRWLRGGTGPSRLNLPSITVDGLLGRTRVTRTVTNVSGSPETFTAQVTGLDGLDVRVRPSVLSLAPGESAEVDVVLRGSTAAQPGSWLRGQLTWTGLQHQARIPLLVRPGAVDAPAEVATSGSSGSTLVEGVAGTGGTLDLRPVGLAGAAPAGLALTPGSFDTGDPVADEDTARFPVTVPAGTELARFQVDGHNAGDDLDLYVYREGKLVAASTEGGADETTTLVRPEAGEYAVYVASHSAANGSTTSGQLYTWLVRPETERNLAVTPSALAAGAGQSFDYEVEWAGLDLTSRWFGAVRYGDSDDYTFVEIR